jgi:hypothetical protein
VFIFRKTEEWLIATTLLNQCHIDSGLGSSYDSKVAFVAISLFMMPFFWHVCVFELVIGYARYYPGNFSAANWPLKGRLRFVPIANGLFVGEYASS